MQAYLRRAARAVASGAWEVEAATGIAVLFGLVRLPFRWLSAALLTALFALNVYRAATQSLVHDEGLTYQMYLSAPWRTMFEVYDANHHFLATLLMRLSMRLFGSSELALRLPTLLAGGWFFVSIFRLAVLAFGDRRLVLLAVILAAGNPLVLDFLVAARGYGLALACLTYGLYCLTAYFSREDSSPARLLKAAVALSLGATANLTVLVPAAVMIGLAMLLTRARHAASMLIPPVVIGLVFYFVSPIRMAHRESFYYGARSLRDCLDYLAAVALAHNFGPWGWNGETWWKPGWRECAAIAVVAMSVAAVCTEAPVLFRRAKASPLDWTLFFAAAVFTGSWTVLLAAHVLVGLPYPLDRTGLYFFPLAGLIVAGLIAKLRAAPRVRALCATLGVLIALEYALELNWRQFVVWRYDADNKTIAQVLAAQTHAQPVRLGLSWPLEPAFHYYRETRGLTWLAPLTREGPDGRYDYYVLIANEQDRIARYHLRVIYRGPVSGTVLAQPNRN